MATATRHAPSRRIRPRLDTLLAREQDWPRENAAMDTNAASEALPSATARPVLSAEHELFRDQVHRFFERHVVPFHRQWERDGIVPREVWRLAGAHGLLCPTMPEAYGGAGADFGYSAVLIEETARTHCSGVGFALHSDIVAPYLLAYATEERKRDWLPRMALGEIIGAIAMTEPGMGSDLKAVRTTARRDGGDYVLNGQKTFITNGTNAGLVIVVAKTDLAAGRKGISLICVEEGTPGFAKGRPLEKIGLHAQDTSELFFDEVRVPAANLLGEENQGFRYLIHNLPQERLIIALRSAASIETLLTETVAYARQRQAFGSTVFEFQNTRFRLADAKAQATMLRVFVDHCLALHLQGGLSVELAAQAKLVASEMQNKLLDEFLQVHGGYGFMSEYAIGRAWADARVARIYGGSSEIMKEIIARTL
jgi:acyl-CoA dehydrogenase